jgi:hypothetical protein
MASVLPKQTRMNTRLRSSSPLDVQKRRVKSPVPSVTLWRPQVVLATKIDPIVPTAPVAVPAPAFRPAAVELRVGAARARLGSLTDARHSLGGQLAGARARAEQATSTRERVEATMQAYRVERSLDELLTGTLREVTAMLEERGLR